MLREWQAACAFSAFSAHTSVLHIIFSSPHLGRQQCEQCALSCSRFAGCNLLPARRHQSAFATQHMHACCPSAFVAAAGHLSAGPS